MINTNASPYGGRGHLIGEYDCSGSSIEETVYPSAPHIITNSSGASVWVWDHLAFGDNAPNQNPSGLGVFSYGARFPGQIADGESGLNYNMFRDYAPYQGRYVQSDPIGLAGTSWGSLNTYEYVGGNPVIRIDPTGLSDINLFPVDSKQYENDKMFNPPNVFSVGGHGNPQVMYDQNGKELSPLDVANLILSDPRYQKGKPVWLNSCSTGSGDNSFAQKLANILEAPVSAPDNPQWYMSWKTKFLGMTVDEYVTENIGPTYDSGPGKRIICAGPGL